MQTDACMQKLRLLLIIMMADDKDDDRETQRRERLKKKNGEVCDQCDEGFEWCMCKDDENDVTY